MLRLITAILAAVYLINAQFVMTAPCSGTQPLGEDESSEFRGEGIDAEMASGPERNMPWINDSEFIEAVARNKTYVMLGGYKTVLKDPLPGEEYNVHLAADMLAGIVVKPGAIFSQNDAIGPYIESRGFRKGPT